MIHIFSEKFVMTKVTIKSCFFQVKVFGHKPFTESIYGTLLKLLNALLMTAIPEHLVIVYEVRCMEKYL